MKAGQRLTRESPDSHEALDYAELLARAHEDGLKSIHTELLVHPSPDNGRLCICKAIVETAKGRFEGLGDADPESIEGFLIPHLIRVAETRAKARALRDAVNCGIPSREEMDGADSRPRASRPGPGARGTTATTTTPSTRKRSTPPRAAEDSNGHDGPMSEAQRRYLFRLLAATGRQGQAAEEFLKHRFGVPALNRATRSHASALIDELLADSPGANGHGARA